MYGYAKGEVVYGDPQLDSLKIVNVAGWQGEGANCVVASFVVGGHHFQLENSEARHEMEEMLVKSKGNVNSQTGMHEEDWETNRTTNKTNHIIFDILSKFLIIKDT